MSTRNWIIIVVVTLFVVIVADGLYYFRPTKNSPQTPQINTTINSAVNTEQLQSSSTQPLLNKGLPPIKDGFQQYKDNDLGFGFNYLLSDSLNKYQELKSFSISRIHLRVDAVRDYEISYNNPKINIEENIKLSCSADGVDGSTFCRNVKIEEYTNLLGFKGFKVLCDKTNERYSENNIATSITYKDVIYIFPLSKEPENNYGYSVIKFSVDEPTQANLSELKTVTDSFFAF